MDFIKLKNLVKQNGDKFILVENGEPEIVMMSFHEYERISRNDSNTRTHSNYSNHSSERLGSFESPYASFGLQTDLRETEFVPSLTSESVGLPVRLEDIRLEDLPV